jgi:hypothetical protein
MTIQNKPGIPVGGLNTIGQIDATNPLCFDENRNPYPLSCECHFHINGVCIQIWR